MKKSNELNRQQHYTQTVNLRQKAFLLLAQLMCCNVCMRYFHRRRFSKSFILCSHFFSYVPLSLPALPFDVYCFWFFLQLLFGSFIVLSSPFQWKGNNIRFVLLNVFNVVASALLFIRCVHVIFFSLPLSCSVFFCTYIVWCGQAQSIWKTVKLNGKKREWQINKKHTFTLKLLVLYGIGKRDERKKKWYENDQNRR